MGNKHLRIKESINSAVGEVVSFFLVQFHHDRFAIKSLGEQSLKARFLIALVLITFSCGHGAIAKGNLDHLKSWAGKYPSDSKPGFFAVQDIRQPLMRLLNRHDFKLLTDEYSVETPIKLLGDYLCAKDCRPHNCGDENAAFAINLQDGSIYVMMRLMDDRGKENLRWFNSIEKYTTLPQAVRDFMTNFGAE